MKLHHLTLPILIVALVGTGRAQLSRVGFPDPVPFPDSASLTPAAIEEAIEQGMSGRVSPYSLREEIGRHPGPNAAVYTPFVRVALAAQTAQRRRVAFDVSPLPHWIVAPVVLVVFASPCKGESPCDFGGRLLHDRTPETAVGLGAVGLRSSFISVAAVGVTRDLGFLDEIGGRPFAQALLAATFQPRDLVPDRDVVAVWVLPDRFRVPVGGRITLEDSRTWR